MPLRLTTMIEEWLPVAVEASTLYVPFIITLVDVLTPSVMFWSGKSHQTMAVACSACRAVDYIY